MIGGFNGLTTIFNVECFDDQTDEWYDAADMNTFRSALSACVLSGLDTVRNLITFARQQPKALFSLPTVGTLSSAVGALTTTLDNLPT